MTDTIVVTRHPALLDLLVERGLVRPGTPAIAHATPEDVRGRHVIGVLPLSLAAIAATVTEIELRLSPEHRGRELGIEELRQVAGPARTYIVRALAEITTYLG
jgi:hypothetical protein